MQLIAPTELITTVIPDRHDIARCTVTLPSGAVTPTLQGKCVEACVVTQQHYVLFLTDDLLYDERLHIYLLGQPPVTVLDCATLGAWDTAAIVSDITLPPPHRIQFSFFGRDCWEVELYKQPHRSWLPRRRGRPWVRRPWQRQHYFELRAVLAPTAAT